LPPAASPATGRPAMRRIFLAATHLFSKVAKIKGREGRGRAKKCRAFGALNLKFFSPRTSVARGAAAPLPSRRLRLALVKRLVAASRRNEPPGPVPKWTARQARLDERELIRTYRLASHDALNDNQAAKELARGLRRVLRRRRRAFDAR